MDSLTTIVGASTRSKSSRVSDKIIEWRQRAYELLEQGAVGSRAGALAGGFIIVVVVVSLLAVTLESVPRYAREHHALFETIEVVTLIVLSIEFLCRLWISIEHPLYRHLSPLRARLAYLASAPALIDLIAVLPFWLTLV